jgi:hypothetical protein
MTRQNMINPSTKFEILNNIKALMTKIQNRMSFGI